MPTARKPSDANTGADKGKPAKRYRRGKASAQTATPTPTPAAPVPEAPAPVVPVSAPDTLAPASHNLPVIYDRVTITEYSVTSEHGPLTVEDVRTMLGWETEKDYQARMMLEKPDSKPEHWLFGEDYHCLNTDKQKVRCWNNANNRPIDKEWYDKLIYSILYGLWAGPLMMPGETINGETVRISRYGRMLSGQHQGTALMLADELLTKSRTDPYRDEATNPKYPAWVGHEHPVIETIVITGLSEDERVLRTIDYVKPRTVADMLYTMELFRDSTPAKRRELTRMLASAIDLLWTRTDTKGYRTHSEIIEFLKRHKRLLKAVEHIFIENEARTTDGRRISKLRLNAGGAAALLYLMGCSGPQTDGDVYRNEEPPSEKNLAWEYWERACGFWSNLAGDRSFIPVRTALGRLIDSKPQDDNNTGQGGRLPEKLALIAKAWAEWKDHPPQAGAPFTPEDLGPGGCLSLEYGNLDDKGNPLPDGEVKLLDVADFGGIDCPEILGRKKDGRHSTGAPEPPPPTREEIERAAAAARARRK